MNTCNNPDQHNEKTFEQRTELLHVHAMIKRYERINENLLQVLNQQNKYLPNCEKTKLLKI